MDLSMLEAMYHLKLIPIQCLLSAFEVFRESKYETASTRATEFQVIRIGFQTFFPQTMEDARNHFFEIVKKEARQVFQIAEKPFNITFEKGLYALVVVMNKLVLYEIPETLLLALFHKQVYQRFSFSG